MTSDATGTVRAPAEFLNDTVRHIQPSGIRRFFDMLAEMKDVISLTIGEPDFTTPEPLTRAAIASLEAGETHYSANGGMLSLRELVADNLANRYGVRYEPRGELVITVGASEGLDATLRAVINPGDEVIYHEPCFVAYAPCITLAGGVPVPLATSDATDFRVTAAQIEAALPVILGEGVVVRPGVGQLQASKGARRELEPDRRVRPGDVGGRVVARPLVVAAVASTRLV
jgi:aminotransferase